MRERTPDSVHPRLFNLWISTKNTKAPLFAADLVAMCQGSGVNPYILGSIAVVRTQFFRRSEAVPDWWDLGADADRMALIQTALQAAVPVGEIGEFPGLTHDEAGHVEGVYEEFLRWVTAYIREPVYRPEPEVTRYAPAPAPAKPPAEPVRPAVATEAPTTPARIPDVPAASVATGSPWKGKLGRAVKVGLITVGLAGGALGVLAWILPPQVSAPLGAVLPVVRAWLVQACEALPECEP